MRTIRVKIKHYMAVLVGMVIAYIFKERRMA